LLVARAIDADLEAAILGKGTGGYRASTRECTRQSGHLRAPVGP